MGGTRKATIGIIWTLVIAATFIVLKLTGVIAWSWWWVLLPLYGPIVLLIIVWLLALAVGAYAAQGRGRW